MKPCTFCGKKATKDNQFKKGANLHKSCYVDKYKDSRSHWKQYSGIEKDKFIKVNGIQCF